MVNLLELIGIRKKKRERVLTNLDEDRIKDNDIIKLQQQKINVLESQLSKIYAQEKEKLDKKDVKLKENKFNEALIEQKKELDSKNKGKVIKLSKFYKLLSSNKKYRNKVEICDKNDEVVLGKFGDIGFLEGGKMCIIDEKGDIMSHGRSLREIIYKPDSFENQIRRGRILIPMDKDGNWLEDLEYKEIPEPLDAEFDEESGKIKRIIWSNVKVSEVKKVIADKMELIHYLQNELERQDGVIIKLKQQIDDLTRGLKIYEAQSDISQTNLSKSLNRFIESEKRVGDMHSSIMKLSELKAVHESLIDRKDMIIDKLIAKLELTGEPKLDRLKSSIKDDLEFYKAILPDRVEIREEPRQILKQSTQPGEVIKSSV